MSLPTTVFGVSLILLLNLEEESTTQLLQYLHWITENEIKKSSQEVFLHFLQTVKVKFHHTYIDYLLSDFCFKSLFC